MNALVAYGSSDEEDNCEHQPERSVKIAKNDAHVSASMSKSSDEHPERRQEGPRISAVILQSAQQESAATPATDSLRPGPAAGPSLPEASPEDSDSFPFDSYTFERQRLREFTMPTIPNFDIPSSPPPPSQNSEEATALAATTKKFERFLELKRQGIHFNERLQSSASLRNPSLLPKLMDFAGISQEDSYRGSLSEEVDVTVKWPDDCFVEGLMKGNERRERKRAQERDRVDFVPARGGASSASGVFRGGDRATGSQRSHFDRR